MAGRGVSAAPACPSGSVMGVMSVLIRGPQVRLLPGAPTTTMSKTARRALPFAVLLAVGVLAGATLAGAEVRHVTIESRVDLLGGRPFGAAGAYEKLTGVVDFAFDPANRANGRIVDLERAPRNAAGFVEARATFMVLRPKRVARPGVALVEVSNRGGKAALPYFNGADWSHDPTTEAELGDGLLMRLGLTIVWVGWQFDVPREPGLLRLEAPVARDGDRPIEGLVRCDFTVDRAVRTLALGHRGHVPYPLADPDHRDNVLTVRDGRLAPRTVVERRDWRFGSEVNGRVVEDPGHITMARGFEAGKLYELVYRASDPVVSGLGLAAIHDVIAYAKHDPQSLFPARLGVAFGVSQTGRFLRHFLYQGFNTDERGRQAFDGMLVHTAGAGRGSFNHRFAQPSRDAHRYSSFFYPTDLFPFTSRPQLDAETGREDRLASSRRARLPRQSPRLLAHAPRAPRAARRVGRRGARAAPKPLSASGRGHARPDRAGPAAANPRHCAPARRPPGAPPRLRAGMARGRYYRRASARRHAVPGARPAGGPARKRVGRGARRRAPGTARDLHAVESPHRLPGERRRACRLPRNVDSALAYGGRRRAHGRRAIRDRRPVRLARELPRGCARCRALPRG